ncbi:Spy/CpxP family protein refolding chaperone [Alkalimonas collagenimarina]|uniref:Spy/CpxP family protein refolding chaperone n=1 Tax=Alkalimonas collagenimarina TaxID=400390 RepID=A0ABT9GVH6_9GAMM|nr:Spy/CpxP family protein refolding chaperone [Alkalimonas collagenimarina]MDP4535055.1 Spy/CpxP family protein refolding chaperone [Alkalimonas collagenimarina]
MKVVQFVSSIMVCSSLLVMAPTMAVESAAQLESAKATYSRDDARNSRDGGKKKYRPSYGGAPRLHGIELTEQQQELRALRQTHRHQFKGQDDRQHRAEHRQAMQRLMQADYFDENQARIVLEQQQQSRLEHQLAELQWRHAVYQLLTEEQRQQWQQMPPRQRGAKRSSGGQRQGKSTVD